MNYPVVIHKEKKSLYGVTVPDLSGCFSAGEILDEAIENTKEAILLHVEGMIDDNEILPASLRPEGLARRRLLSF